jgi:hypothetical protein
MSLFAYVVGTAAHIVDNNGQMLRSPPIRDKRETRFHAIKKAGDFP